MTIDWTKVLIVATALVVVIGFTAIAYADEKSNSMGNHQTEFAIKGCAVSAFQFADKKRPLVADT